MRTPRRRRSFAAAAFLLVACHRAPEADPRLVALWMQTLYGTVRVERASPPVASRLFAYAATALYAGLATTDRELLPLPRRLNGLDSLPVAAPDSQYDGTLAAIAAERTVLDSLLREALPTTRSGVARLADSLAAARAATGIAADVRERSTALGRRIGAAIVAWSRADGFAATRGRAYVAPVGPGLWVNDAPASTYAAQSTSGVTQFVGLDNPANVLRPGAASDRSLILSRPKGARVPTLPAVNIAGASEPYWGQLRPFALRTWNECVIPDPPRYATDSTTALYGNARRVHDVQRVLTPEQREIALYWADNAGESGTPVGHWISIASQMVSARGLTASEAARLTTVTAIAQADAFIAGWGYKYQHNLIRPRTYIRRVIDPTWEPLIPTPPFPEYPSGHATQSSAAATAMTALLGTKAFDDSTGLSIGHAVRRFTSFRAAADEAGLSRIYGGIHYPVGNAAGASLGTCIGARAAERVLARPGR